MNEKVAIHIDSDRLEVNVPDGSPFLSGMHRIFLANVIGLEENKNKKKPGYYLNKSQGNISDVVIELLEYFKEEGGEVKFDIEAEKIISAYDKGSSDFNASKEIGLKLKKNTPKNISVPEFIRDLKPYQVGAVAHLVEVGNVANFSVPGSGKTTITLAGYSILKDKGVIDRIVVIGPRASFMTWEDEFEACFGTKPRVVRITGPVATRRRLYRKAAAAELILLSYPMATNDLNKISAFLTEHKVMLVLDESHNIKNIKKVEKGTWVDTVLSLGPLATRRVILTGTPVPNALEDLWSQFTFLWQNPKILGTTDEYKDRIYNDVPSAIRNVKEDLKPFYWRIHKSQLKLKRPKYHRIRLKMRPYQQAIYDALATKVLAELVNKPEERIKLRAWRRARLIRLLQVASNPTLLNKYSEEFNIPSIDASGLSINELIEEYPKFEVAPKIEAVINLTVELINKNEKVIIWNSFIHNIKTLDKQLSEYNPRIIYGDVPKDSDENELFNREKMIREFKETNEYNILIANPSACAESISLHKICHHAIYLDRTFNCAHYMQSLDRIHRIGLGPNEQVHYYIFLAKNSIDEVINARLDEKHKRMLKILDDDFGVLDLESNMDEISEETEEDADFQAIIKQLKSMYE